MTMIYLSLPPTISSVSALPVQANSFVELFHKVKDIDENVYLSLFDVLDKKITNKAFVSVFCNDELVTNLDRSLQEGDTVALNIAIAGG